MDTFELSEDESPRRDNPPAECAPRRKGTRSFFRRWMEAIREEEAERRAGTGNSLERPG